MVVLRANSTLTNAKQMTASQSVLGIAKKPPAPGKTLVRQ
jgi:hypothetical protein